MFISNRLAIYLSVCALAILLCPAAAQEQGNTVVAEVDGVKLTTTDLDRQEGGKLLQARAQYYDVERRAVDDLIDQKLLEQQAAREHLTVDQLLQREVNAKVTDPTDDQMHVYYEGVQTDKPYPEVRDKILEHIRGLRRAKIRNEYVGKLREKAKISVLLSPPAADVSAGDSFASGTREASVVVVEFADYQCPYCQKAAPNLDKLQKDFGDKVSIVYKDFPLPMHPFAEKAAEAARCAGAQGKFWEYHDLLFRDKKLEMNDLKQQARTLNLDAARFDRCLDSSEQASAVKKDLDEGTRLGVSGTPSFFVNGHFYSGALEYSSLRDAVQQQLSLSAQTQPSTSESSQR
jgi:protein-disulfide isomerase